MISDRPTEVKLGVYINSIYSINEQTMVGLVHFTPISSHLSSSQLTSLHLNWVRQQVRCRGTWFAVAATNQTRQRDLLRSSFFWQPTSDWSSVCMTRRQRVNKI